MLRIFTTRYLEDGLRDRAITRDIEWGIPVPVKGYEQKRLYVWFEGLSLSFGNQRVGSIHRDPEKWRDFWQKDCHSYYFMVKTISHFTPSFGRRC